MGRRDLLKPEANHSSRNLGIKSVFWEGGGEQKSAVCSKPRERSQNGVCPLPWDLLVGSSALGTSAPCPDRMSPPTAPAPRCGPRGAPGHPPAPSRQCVPLWWCPEPVLLAGQALAEDGQGRHMPVPGLHPVPSVRDGAKGCASLSEGTRRGAPLVPRLCCFCPL